MRDELSPLSTTGLITAVGFAIAFAPVYAMPYLTDAPTWGELPPEIAMVVQMKVYFTTVNLVVLFALVAIYVDLYRNLPNKYTRSLLLLSLSLLLYAFSSNPFVQILFGFRPYPNVGVFGFISDVFVGVAIVILLYQSQT
jgi:hypothetical protein